MLSDLLALFLDLEFERVFVVGQTFDRGLDRPAKARITPRAGPRSVQGFKTDYLEVALRGQHLESIFDLGDLTRQAPGLGRGFGLPLLVAMLEHSYQIGHHGLRLLRLRMAEADLDRFGDLRRVIAHLGLDLEGFL